MRVPDFFPGASRLAAALILMATAGCDGGLKESSFGPITDIVTSVTTVSGTATATLGTGERPAASSGPTITVLGIPTAINGGSLRVTVASTTPFSQVVVSLQFFDGFYQLDLPAPVTTIDLVVGMSPEAPQAALGFVYGAAASGGPLGAVINQNINVIRVGSGDVQVSVAWDAATDVDLHVTDPSGEEIYFGNLTSASGGTLDLDSNAACTIDNVNNENIVWPAGGAPTGQYTVHLVYWSACTQPQTNYTVTILVVGQQPQIFSGTLITANANTPIPIGTFTR